jgi:hypothetical protein
MAHVTTGVLRRGARALRAVGPGTIAVAAVALVIGGVGAADAATGGNFLLGDTNVASSTSVLTDTTGIPLSLNAADGKQPLSVNSTVQVNRLNAQYVGGQSAAQLQTTGGVGATGSGVNTPLPATLTTTVVSTGALPAGTYYVTATALVFTGGPDTAYCRIDSAPLTYGGGGGGDTDYVQAAETGVVTVAAGTVVSEGCYATGSGQYADDASITAIRISSSSVGSVPCLSVRTRSSRDRTAEKASDRKRTMAPPYSIATSC